MDGLTAEEAQRLAETIWEQWKARIPQSAVRR